MASDGVSPKALDVYIDATQSALIESCIIVFIRLIPYRLVFIIIVILTGTTLVTTRFKRFQIFSNFNLGPLRYRNTIAWVLYG